MVQVSGPLKIMTDKPSRVSEVWVGSPQTRPHGGGLLVEERDKVTPVGGVLSFTSVPGPVLLTLLSGGRVVDSVRGIVPDKESATLAEVVRAVGLADAGTLTALEELALEVAADAARVGTAAQVGVWADQASGAASDAAAAAAAADNSASAASGSATTAATAASSVPGRVTTEITTQLPAKIDQLVPPKVAEVIGSDTIIQDAAAAAVGPLAQGAVDAAADAITWIRRNLTLGEDMNLLTTQGVYRVSTWTIANSLINKPPQEAIQEAVVTVTFTGHNVHQNWQRVSPVGQDQVEMVRHMERSGVWSAWRYPWSAEKALREIAATRWGRPPIPANADLNAYTTPGVYPIPTWGIANGLINRPPQEAIQAATLTVVATGTTVKQTWEKISAVGQDQVVMVRHRGPTGEWAPWSPPWGATKEDPRVGVAVEQPARIDMLRQASRLRRGGVVGLSGRTPVALSFDHGFKNFRDLVLPELIRLGLPCTVAVNPDTFTTPQEGNVTWSELQEWCLNHGVELAHHARSHGDVPDALTNPAALEHAILSTIDEARAQAPEVVADAMIMPGVSGTKWQGFDAINDYDLWWEHPAGRMVLGNFPVVTWGMYGVAVPMVGQPVQGVDRIGLDTVSQINTAKSHIQAAEGTGLGISVFMHPVYVNQSGRPSLAQLRSFLEWLAAERDAGRVEVLTVSGFAYADPSRHRRLDLAPEGQWEGNTYTVEVDPLLNWAQGAQVVLETTADMPGTWTLSASSDVGGLDAVHRITGVEVGDRLRLAFSIPRTAKSITVHAYGTDRSCRVV